MIYRLLRTLSLVFSLALFLYSSANAQGSPQEEPPSFTVEGVEVDVTAKDAMAARDKAFETAQEKAFDVLAKRFVKEEASANYKKPGLNKISSLIKDYEVTKEKLSSVRYIGTYTFQFDERASARFFNLNKDEKTDDKMAKTDTDSKGSEKQKPLLILPFYQKDGLMALWSADNPWMEAWKRSKNAGSLLPIAVPIGDLKDMQDIEDHQALTYGDKELQNILNRYGAGRAAIVIAAPDQSLSMIKGDNKLANGALLVTVYRTENFKPEYVDKITVTAIQDQTIKQVMDRAALRVQGILKQGWNQTSKMQLSQGKELETIIPIRSLSDWSSIQRALKQTEEIRDIMLQTLTPHQAYVKIAYQGDQERLIWELEQAGFVLTQSRQEQEEAAMQGMFVLTRRNPLRSPDDLVVPTHSSVDTPKEPSSYTREF